jgi:hypothetical protein
VHGLAQRLLLLQLGFEMLQLGLRAHVCVCVCVS